MPIWTKTVDQMITVRYRIGLGVIALLVVISFVVTAFAIEFHRERVVIVDIAAKQRVYSQRIPFLANVLAANTVDNLRKIYWDELKEAVAGMERGYAILSLERPTTIPKRMRTLLREVYHSGPKPFGPQMERFLDYARTVLSNEYLHTDQSQLVKLSNMSSTFVLESNDRVYKTARKETLSALNRSLGIVALLWVVTLVVIGLEVPLIFRPMAGRTADSLRRLETARQTAEHEAAEAEAARNENVVHMRIMNHEMRTPLNAIQGLTALMRMDDLPRKQVEYARQIQQAANHLTNLVNHILDFGELEADLVRVKPERILLRDELEKVLSTFNLLAAEKGLTMTCALEGDLADEYMADGARIRQALAYLVGNAVKFTEEGTISLRARYEREAGRAVDLVRFEVKDTGLGVPSELREYIFREWHQVEDSLARKYGGMGLGLTIARWLVHLMDGEIGVESADGKGSLFWFTLPLKRAEESNSSGGGRRPK